MVEPCCEAAGDYEQKLPSGAVMQGPREGAVDHGLEKADSQKVGIFTGHWQVSALGGAIFSFVTCIVLVLFCFVLKTLL